MAGQPQSGRLSEPEFIDLLQALSATTKGRLFLAEYLRRFRPEETRMLLDALQRIEAATEVLRDQLQPERLAGELRRLATTLEIAISGADAEADPHQRKALLARVRADLARIADTLADTDISGETTRIRSFEPATDLDEIATAPDLGDDLAFVDSR